MCTQVMVLVKPWCIMFITWSFILFYAACICSRLIHIFLFFFYILDKLSYYSLLCFLFLRFSDFSLFILLFSYLSSNRIHLCIGNMNVCTLFIQWAYNLNLGCCFRGVSNQPNSTDLSDFIIKMHIGCACVLLWNLYSVWSFFINCCQFRNCSKYTTANK